MILSNVWMVVFLTKTADAYVQMVLKTVEKALMLMVCFVHFRYIYIMYSFYMSAVSVDAFRKVNSLAKHLM